MLALLSATVPGTFEPALQIDPIAHLPWIRACRSGWIYPKDRYGNVNRELPVKNHPHSDVGDGFCYLASIASPTVAKPGPPARVIPGSFDPRTYADGCR